MRLKRQIWRPVKVEQTVFKMERITPCLYADGKDLEMRAILIIGIRKGENE